MTRTVELSSQKLPASAALSCLVIGHGSIGSRHARILSAMGNQVACVTQREDVPCRSYKTIQGALAAVCPDLAVIATPTGKHLENYLDLAHMGYGGVLLVEKPLFSSLPAVVPALKARVFLGYNLRYHPAIQKIRALLADREVFSAQFSAGQFLPDWRPGTDYRQCYSASRSGGGGVLRDLSHELDLALWLFGPWQSVTANCGKRGRIEIATEDTVDILASLTRCQSVAIHLDYQNLFPRRVVSVQAESLSIVCDLVGNTLRVNGESEEFYVPRDYTYLAEWDDILSPAPQFACSMAEGVEVMKFIAAVETASTRAQWVVNK